MTAAPLIDVVSLRTTADDAHLRVFTTDDTAALDQAAADWDPDSGTMPELAQGAAYPFATDDMRWFAWADYAQAVRQREHIAMGTEHWLCRFPDRSYDEALDEACELADRARGWFLTGVAR